MGGSEVLVLESNQNHARAEDTEVCPTLPASMGLGGGYVPMIVEPIAFRDDITIKIDGGGVGFTLGSRDFKGVQCVVVCGKESTEKQPLPLTDITTLDAEQGGGENAK